MSLINETYFIGDISIPPNDFGNILTYVTKYERQCLIDTLGYALYKEIAAYTVSGSTQRIKDIVEGKEYTFDDMTVKWGGLVNDEKESPLAYYIYYFYMKGNKTITGNVNEMALQSENSESASIVDKLVYSWDKFMELAFHYVYPFNSLFAFLQQNESTYPEWEIVYRGRVNQFDL